GTVAPKDAGCEIGNGGMSIRISERGDLTSERGSFDGLNRDQLRRQRRICHDDLVDGGCLENRSAGRTVDKLSSAVRRYRDAHNGAVGCSSLKRRFAVGPIQR